MPEVVAGRYELGDRLGAGGISDVYAAYDRRLGRPVAIKFLRAGLGDARARSRFEREARIAANFNHPHAVAIYDVGEHEDRPYLVLELVDGPSLAQLLAQQGRLDPHEAVRIADQVLDALTVAHARGLVHRDVKPSNVLLTRDHAAKLSDFGIAKAVADATGGLTMTGEVVGTPRYLSPEQVAGHPATPRSDLYALGVVLYETLAGTPPFQGETPIATALAHQSQPVPSLTARRPGLDPGLVGAIERALDKNPNNRFADAAEMRQALVPLSRGATASPLTGAAPDVSTVADVGATSGGAARTQAMPRPSPRRSEPPRRAVAQRLWIIGGVALAALVLVGLAVFALTDDSGNDLASTRQTTAAPTSTAPPTTTTTPRPTVAPTTLPGSIDALIATLAANPTAYGSHARDLLTSLQQLQRANGKHEDDKSTQKTIANVRKWIADGTLNATIGNLALQLLQTNSG